MADIFNFTDTWNNGATAFDAIKCNVTDTASDAASLLINMQVGSSTKFSVRKDGHVVAASEAIGGATLGTNALAVNGQVTNAGGTITTSQPFTITQTWNAAGVTFNGILANITTTASASLSTLMDLQVGGASKFTVFKSGSVQLANAQGMGMGTADINFTRNGMSVASTSVYGFSNSSSDVVTLDTQLSRNAAGVIQFGTTAANASGAWLAAKGTLTGGTLADQANVLAITATQPASPTGTQNAIATTITSAGSASQDNIGLNISYAAGYTGSSRSVAAAFSNAAAGTGAILIRAGNTSNLPSSNLAVYANTNGSTATGYNVGLAGGAGNAVVNVGLIGQANLDINSGTNMGVVGSALNAGTSPKQIGGFFTLGGSVPTVSAALIADNGSQTDAIFLARLAGVTKVSVEGSAGNLVVSTATDSTTTTSGSVQIAGGMAVRKRIFADGLTASAGLQTAVICQSSAGELIADSVACLASSARFKDLLGDAENGALDKIIRVPVQRWKYRREEGSVFPDNYYSEHIGPTAEDIEAIDSRLVGRDKEGKVRSISTDQLLALAIQAIQEQQVQIEELKARAA